MHQEVDKHTLTIWNMHREVDKQQKFMCKIDNGSIWIRLITVCVISRNVSY